MKPPAGRHHLLIDADDTLWENNIYFEDAFEQFVDFLDHSSMSAAEVRTVLDEIEIANIKIHGYGAANFARNLAQCYERLAEREIRQDDLRTVMSYAERILDCPMQLISGVSETLVYLSARHELTLFTKGHPEEQKLKIDRSGLGELFHHTAIVREKDTESLRYSGAGARAKHGADMDGGEQSEVGYQSGAGCGAKGGLHSSSTHVGPGARGNSTRGRAIASAEELSRTCGCISSRPASVRLLLQVRADLLSISPMWWFSQSLRNFMISPVSAT